MSNERLRSAIVSAGMTPQTVSEQIGVDPKTVERWITSGRIPRRTHRTAVGTMLGKDDVYLWPATESDARTRSASQDEFVAIYPNRGSIAVDTWTRLLDQSTESIDLLAFAASFLHDNIPDFDERLVAKARAGTQVRLLFGDPDAESVRVRGDEEGIGDLLAARCRLTWNYLRAALDQPGVLARQHDTTLYSSIFRFDDTLIANTHTFGAPANQSPVLHLHRIPGGRLFANYMLSFERTWDRAEEVSPVKVA